MLFRLLFTLILAFFSPSTEPVTKKELSFLVDEMKTQFTCGLVSVHNELFKEKIKKSLSACSHRSNGMKYLRDNTIVSCAGTLPLFTLSN